MGWTGGGGWVHLKGAGSIAVSTYIRLGLEKPSKVLLPCGASISGSCSRASFPVYTSSSWLRVMTIESSLMGGCVYVTDPSGINL